jgi:hypothetical protein
MQQNILYVHICPTSLTPAAVNTYTIPAALTTNTTINAFNTTAFRLSRWFIIIDVDPVLVYLPVCNWAVVSIFRGTCCLCLQGRSWVGWASVHIQLISVGGVIGRVEENLCFQHESRWDPEPGQWTVKRKMWPKRPFIRGLLDHQPT